MRPWPILLAVLLIASALLAPRSARAESKFDQITVLQNDAKVTLWKIDRPNVTRARTQYPSIKFHPGDDIEIFAGGCVQTGGWGRTWKSYTNPLGSSADVYYSGTVYIPGVIPFGADGGFQRIGGHINRLLHVPDNLPPTISPDQLFLQLGYQDNGYDDNSYGAHDDGNYDQCKGVGAAWVQVRVTKHPAAVAQFTPWSKPFDVTWKTNSIDANGLPVNPFWAAQIDLKGVAKGDPVQQAPNFAAACGPAFSWNWGSHGLDEDVGVLAAKCTSQQPTTDLDHSASVEPCCYCHPDPIDGHLDWLFATYSGLLYWEDFSGGWPNDGDLNFQLAPTGGAGLTDLNGASIGLEFNNAETVDNFTSPFWKTIHEDAENNGGGDLADRVNGRFAMITGLLGIDGVHGGYAELHPVMAMAICIKGCTVMQSDDPQTPIVEGADQTWAFFLQNYGNGGQCSSSEHYWPGLTATDDASKAWYFLSLPQPPGATAVTMISQNIMASQTLNTAAPARWKSWTYVGFEIPTPDASGGAQIDGEFVIHYAFDKPPGHHKPFIAAGKPKGHAEEGADLADVVDRVADPATRSRLMALIQSSPPARAAPRLHSVALRLGNDPGAAKAVAMITPARASVITRDRPFLNVAALQQKHAFFQQMVQILPLQPRPGQILKPVRVAPGVLIATPDARPKIATPDILPTVAAPEGAAPPARPVRRPQEANPIAAPQS